MQEVVKQGLHRRLIKDGPHALKVYRHARPWGRPFDRARAAAELRWLGELSRLGLAVPRPIGLERGPEGWQIRMQWIEGGRPLPELLEGLHGERARVLAERVGKGLARLHTHGIRHPDPHLGNVVVDAEDRPWFLDWKGARRGNEDRAAEREDLVSWLASVREALEPAARRALLRGWGVERDGEEPPLALWLELERDARTLRRSLIEHGAGRWLRSSSQVTLEKSRDMRLIQRRCAEDVGHFGLWVRPEPGRRLWRNAARLFEHGLAAAIPHAMQEKPGETMLVFRRPEAVNADPASDPSEARGRLLGQLHERGLDLGEFGSTNVALDPGGPWLTPPLDLLELDALGATRERRFGPVQPDWLDASFERGYLTAFAPHDREVVARRLRGSNTPWT